jgi:hypothetical protein
MTTCHIGALENIGPEKHTQEVLRYTDTLVNGGKKWEVLHIKI